MLPEINHSPLHNSMRQTSNGGFVPDAQPDIGFVPDKPTPAPDLGFVSDADAKLAALNASIDPTAFNSTVHQPSQYSGGFAGPPSLENADDWGFTEALAGPSGPPAEIGKALDVAGKAVKGNAEALLFLKTGQPALAAQQIAATASEISPETSGEFTVEPSSPYSPIVLASLAI